MFDCGTPLGDRVLATYAELAQRVAQLAAAEQLHAYFASDALILKLKGLIEVQGYAVRLLDLPALARLLSGAWYTTSRGHAHWWPAQVEQLLKGRFEHYYERQEEPSVQ